MQMHREMSGSHRWVSIGWRCEREDRIDFAKIVTQIERVFFPYRWTYRAIIGQPFQVVGMRMHGMRAHASIEYAQQGTVTDASR